MIKTLCAACSYYRYWWPAVGQFIAIAVDNVRLPYVRDTLVLRGKTDKRQCCVSYVEYCLEDEIFL